MLMENYVHGYSDREAERLADQAAAVRNLIHYDTAYPPGSLVLEAGCGTGAQTVTIAEKSPGAEFLSIDISAESLAAARAAVEAAGLTNVRFERGDVYNLPYPSETFDHVFVCYLLEHLPDPAGALQCLKRVLRKCGSIALIEGDHGSCYWHPETAAALRAWRCLIEVQSRLGGDSLIGRRLFPLLSDAGFREIKVSPRMVYCDQSRPSLVDAFVRKTIIAMVEGVKDKALAMGLIDEATWLEGIADLNRVADSPGGTFCYTFFKAVAVR
jgi:SAM-dependent methyltransferase